MSDPMPRKDLTMPPTPREAELIRERDRALALVAAAYEAAAIDVSEWGTLMYGSEYATFGIMSDIRALTPADAKAALDRLIAEAVQADREKQRKWETGDE